MIRFWGQPKFGPDQAKMIGYELFLREYSQAQDQWLVPTDFSKFSARDVYQLLDATLNTFPQGLKLISFNLDQAQFVDDTYSNLIGAVVQKHDFDLIVELTERVGAGVYVITTESLVQAAKRFNDAGVKVCIDDIGTGLNQPALIAALDPYTVEYKYALQNVRGRLDSATIKVELSTWQCRAVAKGKYWVIEGFEDEADKALIAAFHPSLVQGYYYGRPHLIPVRTDFCSLLK